MKKKDIRQDAVNALEEKKRGICIPEGRLCLHICHEKPEGIAGFYQCMIGNA